MATGKQLKQSTSQTNPRQSAKRPQLQKSAPAPATLNRSVTLQSSTPQQILQLQRTIGNRAVQRLLSRVQDQPVIGAAGGEVSSDVQTAIDQARGGGQPLEAGVATRVGEALATDFSEVRVHTDANSQAINHALGAKAATVGNDIFFSAAAYNPGTTSGQHLLAHELTHVVQQGGSRVRQVQTQLKVGAAHDRYEQEAERTAQKIMQSPTRSDAPQVPLLHSAASSTAPQRHMLQRSLTLDGQPVKSFEALSPEQASALKVAIKAQGITGSLEFDRQIIEALIDHSDRMQLTLADLLGLIPQVYQLYIGEVQITDPNNLAFKVMQQIQATDTATTTLGQSLDTKVPINPRNAAAFNRILDQHPEFLKFMQQRQLGFKFNSSEAKGIGGMYKRKGGPGGTVHLDPVAGKEPPDIFLRAFIHEIGHGTFQQLLLKEKLDSKTSKDGFIAMRARYAVVTAALNQQIANDTIQGHQRKQRDMGAVAQLAPLLSEQAHLEELLPQEEAKFTRDGKKMYDAWQILRANQGQHMLGVDLGKVASAEQRKGYQAATFEEFCAESFMHVVKEPGALTDHVQALGANGQTPPNVMQAWVTTLGILIKYRELILDNK
jgi:hypothetical protein